MAPKAEKEFTMEEVSKHNTQDDCWLVIGNETNGELVLAAATTTGKNGDILTERAPKTYISYILWRCDAVRCGKADRKRRQYFAWAAGGAEWGAYASPASPTFASLAQTQTAGVAGSAALGTRSSL